MSPLFLDIADDGFRETVQRWLGSLDDATLSDLSTVLSSSPGFYPTTLYVMWKHEVERRGIPATPRSNRGAPKGSDIPVSHPDDCDWRFTPESADEIVRQAIDGRAPGDLVAHLGTPTTFAVGVQKYPTFQHVLFERNATMTAALRAKHLAGKVIDIDLAVSRPSSLGASAAVVDPPWYLGDSLTFLAASSLVCCHDARILLCQPTPATRPGILGERATLISELSHLGLELEEIRSGAVRYMTPHFEAMSLRSTATDLQVPGDWRTGDLIVLRKTDTVRRPPTAASSDGCWREVHFGPVRIKLRPTTVSGDLTSIVPGDVLGTVSRRDPIRRHIGLWTSGNRVLALADPDRTGRLIDRCNSDLVAMRFTLARTLKHAQKLGVSASTAQRLFDLLLIELQEHRLAEGHGWAGSRYLAS